MVVVGELVEDDFEGIGGVFKAVGLEVAGLSGRLLYGCACLCGSEGFEFVCMYKDFGEIGFELVHVAHTVGAYAHKGFEVDLLVE